MKIVPARGSPTGLPLAGTYGVLDGRRGSRADFSQPVGKIRARFALRGNAVLSVTGTHFLPLLSTRRRNLAAREAKYKGAHV